MNKFQFTIKVLSIAIFTFALASLAQAQATRTWVSGVGDDANPCSRTAPCSTFAGAISKTATNGEINCLDSGGFGSVTITKSITIKCEGVIGGIVANGVTGIIINDSQAANPGTAIVTLSGLDLEGVGTGLNGIRFLSGSALHVHKTQIRGFRGGGANGIIFAPTGFARLFVADCYITDNGSNGITGGITIRPTGANGSANVTVNRTQIENNSAGIIADGSATTGVAVNVSVRDSLVGGSNSFGITCTTTAGNAGVVGTVQNTMVTGNFVAGLNANGPAASGAGSAIIRVDHSTITLNVSAITVGGAGQVRSFTNNVVTDNLFPASETFTGNDPPK